MPHKTVTRFASPRIIGLALLGWVAFAIGCAGPRSTVVLIAGPDGKVGQVVVTAEGGQQVLDGDGQAVRIAGKGKKPGPVETLRSEEIRTTFAAALLAQPSPPVTFILYFLPDSDELTEESKASLPQIFATIQQRESTDIVVSGHTDTVGDSEHNAQLALGRAQATAAILVANGASQHSITVTSHGEGNPLVVTADDVEEPRNRRVEVVIR